MTCEASTDDKSSKGWHLRLLLGKFKSLKFVVLLIAIVPLIPEALFYTMIGIIESVFDNQ
jgi:hypothetical protein